MANLCNVDGRISSEADARIPVLDRGFLFGDSIYEVVRTHSGVPLTWSEHWNRLNASAASLAMELDLSESDIARRVAETLAQADHGDSYVRIIVTRGTGDAPNIDLAYANSPPRWVLMIRPLQLAVGKPVHLAMVDRLRNDRRALDPAAKSGNYLNNVLGLAEAKASGATDCIMLNQDGSVTEASTSNLFARIDGVWCTPPLNAGILAGITRGMLLEFLPKAGERIEERSITGEELDSAEEIFLSSTLRDIGPVTHLNGRALHPDRPDGVGGESTTSLMPAFGNFIERRLVERDGPHWRSLLGK
ncbi:MAG: branched-chain amino acid aminotransferase [Planctomycetota bacterium]|jgi:branched-chain amino acid aminotransferase